MDEATYTPSPEESLSEALDLVRDLDRTARDAHLGYVRNVTLKNAALKVLPGVERRIRSAMNELNTFEEDHAAERHLEQTRTEQARCEHIETISVCNRCLEPLP
jgi:hypothetical protein